MKSMKILPILSLIALSLFEICAVAAPQSGVWLIDNGQNAYGGDSISFDTQDNKVLVTFAAGEVPLNTYFMYGIGVLNGDNVTVDLISSKDGTARRVVGRFDTSTSGVLDFPGVGQRSVTRAKINDETTPESMFGLWSFSYISNSTDRGMSRARKFVSKLPGTTTGNGIAVDTTGLFACEYQRSGSSVGYTLCVEVNSQGDFLGGYALKRSVHQADGLYTADGRSFNYFGFANKLMTENGGGLILKGNAVPHENIQYIIEKFSATYDGGLKPKEQHPGFQ